MLHIHGQVTNLENGRLDLDAAVFRSRSGDVTLSQTEIGLLRYMLERPNEDLTRTRLHTDVWGYAPSVQSRSCDTAMRRLRAKIERDPAAPRHLLTVRSVGYRFAPLESAVSAGVESSDGLIGQRDALAEVVTALAMPGRLIAVTGAPGVGKSRVAAEAICQAKGPLTLHIDCSGILDSPQLLCVLADRLALPPEDAHVHAIARVLVMQPVTLFLDNCEHLLESMATWSAWAERAPSARILLTSRSRIPGQDVEEVRVAPLQIADAMALFASRSDREFDSADAEVVQQIVTSCDCLPLAIELAAARGRLMAPQELLRRLNRSLTLLRDRARVPRHATLEATLRVSWELLSPDEQAALGQATVFIGGFGLRAAEEVVELESADPLDVFEALADHSLLRLQSTPGGMRISLSETVHAFASERAAETTMTGALQRHARYYASMGPEQPDTGWRLPIQRADVDNALQATRAMILTGQWTAAARAWLAAGSNRIGHAPWSQLLQLVDALLGGALSAPWRARVLVDKGLLLRDLRHLRPGTEALVEALALAQELGLTAIRDRAELGLAGLALFRSNFPEADERLQRLATRQTVNDDPVFAGLVHRQRFSLAQWQGDTAAAHKHLDAALQAFIVGNAPEEESVVRSLLGVLLTTADQLDLAQVQLRLAVDGARVHSTPLWLARALLPLAHNRGRAGAFDEAAEIYEEARVLFTRIGRVAGAAIATGQLGITALRLGDDTLAESHLRSAIGVLGALEGAAFLGQTAILHCALATVLMRTGRQPLAEARISKGVAARPVVTNPAMRIALELMLAEAFSALGRTREVELARTCAEEHGASERLLMGTDGHTP